MIPVLDVSPLFGGASSERDLVDAAILDAATSSGFFTIVGPTEFVPTDSARRNALLQAFTLEEAQQRALWRQFFEPANANVYRGWNPRSAQHAVDIYDMGRDIAYPTESVSAHNDPLTERTPLPPDSALPGWHAELAGYYRAMERVGAAVMASVARSLGIDEHFFDEAFADGISTLRLLRYELPAFGPEDSIVNPGKPRRGEHVDSGFVTLLVQHGVGGLAAKMPSGEWVDVPPIDGHVTVNFGGLLERWTNGRIRATPHRVVSHGNTRYSIPFFYEPSAHAVIRPLPTPDAASFEPFTYGDHLWAAMTKFPNFAGIASLRTPRGVAG